MQIGISSACMYPNLTEDSFLYLARNDVKNIEIFLSAYSELDDSFLKYLLEIKNEYGINVTSIHPFTSGYESYLLFQNYNRRTNDSIELYKKYFNFAAVLGAEILVLHGGKPNNAVTDEEYFERYLKISDVALESGIILAQENVNLFRSQSPIFIKKMIEYLGTRALFVFDIKQSIRAGFSPWEMYNAMRGHIVHMHLSDHNDESDCLLPLKGDFNYDKLFRILEADCYTGSAVIEVYRNAYKHEDEIIKSYIQINEKLGFI